MSDPVEMYRTPWRYYDRTHMLGESQTVYDNRRYVVFDASASQYVSVQNFHDLSRVVRCVNFLSTAQDDILDAIAGSPVHQMILGLLSGDKELATLAAQSVADAILGDEPGLVWKENVT